jgi:hypothetical protein
MSQLGLLPPGLLQQLVMGAQQVPPTSPPQMTMGAQPAPPTSPPFMAGLQGMGLAGLFAQTPAGQAGGVPAPAQPGPAAAQQQPNLAQALQFRSGPSGSQFMGPNGWEDSTAALNQARIAQFVMPQQQAGSPLSQMLGQGSLDQLASKLNPGKINPYDGLATILPQYMAEQRLQQHGQGALGIQAAAEQRQQQLANWQTSGDRQKEAIERDLFARGGGLEDFQRMNEVYSQLHGQPSASGAPPAGQGLPSAPLDVRETINHAAGESAASRFNDAFGKLYAAKGPEYIQQNRTAIMAALEKAFGADTIRSRAMGPSPYAQPLRSMATVLSGLIPGTGNNFYSPEGRANLRANFQMPLGEMTERNLGGRVSRESEENALLRNLLGR